MLRKDEGERTGRKKTLVLMRPCYPIGIKKKTELPEIVRVVRGPSKPSARSAQHMHMAGHAVNSFSHLIARVASTCGKQTDR